MFLISQTETMVFDVVYILQYLFYIYYNMNDSINLGT